MIITCEQCNTRYQVDDNKFQKIEFRVRCQKCQHIFVVRKENAPEEIPVELDETTIIREKIQLPKPCRTITICNQKGGVAKTSTCINLGASLALLKKRVLLIDFDVQSNLSMLLGVNNAKSFFDVIHSDDEEISKCILKTKGNLWLLPSNSKMALLSKKHLADENFEYLLREKLEGIKSHFDYILIDTPPSGDFFTLNALMTSNLAIIPTQCEYLSMNGVEHIESMIQVVKEKTRHPIDHRILITMYNEENTVARVILKKFKARYPNELLDTIIKFDQKIQESQIVHSPVIHYDKMSPAGQQYLSLAKEIDQVNIPGR